MKTTIIVRLRSNETSLRKQFTIQCGRNTIYTLKVPNFGKWTFFKLTDMATFRTNTSSKVKKLQSFISFESNNRNQCLCYLLFYQMVETRFLISERVFHWFLPNYIQFVHETSHTQPSKYNATSGTRISICLKKIGGWGCGSEQAPLTFWNTLPALWIKHDVNYSENLKKILQNHFTRRPVSTFQCIRCL